MQQKPLEHTHTPACSQLPDTTAEPGAQLNPALGEQEALSRIEEEPRPSRG